MALDLYLQQDASLPETSENHFLAFEDDGYFWFLYAPFFEEVARETGRAIDLYDGGFFDGEDLDLFHRLLESVRAQIKEKPDMWQECTGTIVYQGEGKVGKMFSTVIKKRLEAILFRLENAINEAKNKNLGIYFLGD